MGSSSLWRYIKLGLVGKEQQTNLVVIADRTKSQERSHLGCHFAFAFRDATETSGSADINEQQDRKLAFLHIFSYKRFPHSSGDVPIDCPDFITDLIRAKIIEIHPSPSEDTMILSRESGFYHPPSG